MFAKKAIVLMLVLTASLAAAQTLNISSDETVLWSADNLTWYPAFNTWVHPAWPSIQNASWIWRTNLTDPADEYNSVPDGGWYFKKTFEIPECVDEQNMTGSVTAASDNAYRMFFNGVDMGGRGVMDKDGPDALSWQLQTTFNLTGLVTGTNTIMFRALNYFSTGTYSSNPAGLIFKIEIDLPQTDSDGDGVGDCYDNCIDTYNPNQEDSDQNGIGDACEPSQNICDEPTIDEPEVELGTNRWIWNGTAFVTNDPKGKGPRKSYSIEDTQNCSCFQILEWLNQNYPEEFGEMTGHYKFGCSSSVMDAFLELTAN